MKIVSEHTAHQILFKQIYIDECFSEMSTKHVRSMGFVHTA